MITRNLAALAINQSELNTVKSLRKDKNLVTLLSDNGRMTVVMERADYNDKVTALLKDTTA